MNQDLKIRLFFLLLLFVHAAFIIYGSLVPFTFETMPLSRAVTDFQGIVTSPPGSFSKTNLLANIIIGIPGPFLLLGAFHKRNTRPSLPLLAAALLYSALLAATAEFLQLFVPSRITMLSDILAQTAGGFMGLLTWLWVGPYIRSMLKALMFPDNTIDTGAFIFYSYLAVLFLMHALPLDLSPKPGDLYNQWLDGRIVLVPFSSLTGFLDIFKHLPAIIIWIPVGWYLSSIKNWSIPLSCFAVFIGIFLLEFMQLVIMSRTTDITDIILAITGGLAGSAFARSKAVQNTERRPDSGQNILWAALLFTAWLAFVVAVFWLPFTFTFDKQFLKESISGIGLTPLQMYTRKPYLHSALNILSIIVYFLPLGILFSTFVTRHFSGQPARAMSLLFLILAGLLAGIIEFGQVFIPERYPDITDWLCMLAGAMLGHSVSNLVWKKAQR